MGWIRKDISARAWMIAYNSAQARGDFLQTEVERLREDNRRLYAQLAEWRNQAMLNRREVS